ncbi:Ribosomal protein L22e [Trinorchestia longiramus]|nr:Ribosomal protein L22e [Trinorchestia longiramus]
MTQQMQSDQRAGKGALLDDRPHTISSAYEKSHVRERPALGPNTFTLPNPSSAGVIREGLVTPAEACEGAPSGNSSPLSTVSSSNHHHHQQQQQQQLTATISRRSSRSSVLHYHHSASNSQESINSQSSSASGVRSKPPLPSRCSSLERPALPEKKQSTGSSFRQRLPLHHLLHHHHQSKNSNSQDGVGEPMGPPAVPDFNKAPADMTIKSSAKKAEKAAAGKIAAKPVTKAAYKKSDKSSKVGKPASTKDSKLTHKISATSVDKLSKKVAEEVEKRAKAANVTKEKASAKGVPKKPISKTGAPKHIAAAVAAESAKDKDAKAKLPKRIVKYSINYKQPVDDGIMSITDFEPFLAQKFRFRNRLNNLGETAVIKGRSALFTLRRIFLCCAVVPQPLYSNMSELGGGSHECAPIEGENSPHGSLSSSGYGSQPSVRNHDDLPTLDETLSLSCVECPPVSASHCARYASATDVPYFHGRHSVTTTECYRLSTPVTTILEQRGEDSGDDQFHDTNTNFTGSTYPAPLLRSLTAPNTPTDGQSRSLIPHSISAHHLHQYHQQQYHHVHPQQQQFHHQQQQQQQESQEEHQQQYMPPLPPQLQQVQHASQYRHGRFSMPAIPHEMQQQLYLRHQEMIMQQQQQQQQQHDSHQESNYPVVCPSTETLRPQSVDGVQKISGVDQRRASQGVRNTGSLRRSANGKPPPPIRRTASISTSSSSLNSAPAAVCCGASSGGARPGGVPPPLQHTVSSSSLKNASTGGLIHSSSSTSLPQHLSSTELSHASSSSSLPQNASSSSLSQFQNVSNSSSSLQNNFHNSSSSISLSNGVGGGNHPTHDYSNSSSNNGSVMTLSGGDNGCSGSVMTLNGDLQNSSDVGPPVSEVPPSTLRCNGDGAADSDGETNTPRGSMESFPPPPDFLLEDDLSKSFSADKHSAGDGSEDARLPLPASTGSDGLATERELISGSLPTIMNEVSEASSALSPEELSKEVAKQLAPIYQNKLRSGNSNQLGLGGGNNSSSQTSQNSSPSSLDQLSPLLDDDHPSPPSPCPPSPCPPVNYNAPPTPSPHSSPQELVKGYSLFGPPEPIQDEGLSKRSVSVSEAVRNLQETKHQPPSPSSTRKLLTPSSSSQSPTSDQHATNVTNNVISPVTDNHATIESSLSRRDVARASVISTLSSKMNQQQETGAHGQAVAPRSNSQYDPYTQPLPMKLHQDEVMQQVLQQKTDSRQLSLNSPNHNTQVLQPSSSPNANSQPLTQQQHLEQLQQQQQHLIQQQQLLHEKHFKQLHQQSTTSQPLITKPESRAFLATLNSALSQRPTPPQKSQHLRSSVSNSTQKPQLKTQLSTPSPTSRPTSGGSNKTPLRSNASAPKITKPKRSIVMGTASRTNSSSSSSAIPQLNSSGNHQSSSRLSRTGSSSSDKFKFRQLIASGRNSSSSNGQSRETAVSSLASSRPKSVSSTNNQLLSSGTGASDLSSPRGGGLSSMPAGYGSSNNQLREGLLEQIRKGAKLRQTKQIADRSAPRVH